VICDEENADGRARVTTDGERVIQYMCIEQRLCRQSGWPVVRIL